MLHALAGNLFVALTTELFVSDAHVCVLSGRTYLCNSIHCLNAAHDQFALITYGCLPEDMCWAPPLHVRPSSAMAVVAPLTPVSIVDHEAKHTVAAPRASSTELHVPKIEIDLSGASDDGDMDINLPDLEEFEESSSQHNNEHKSLLAQGQDGVVPQSGIDSTSTNIKGCAKSISCSGLWATAEAGVQTKHNRIFKVIAKYVACASF